MAVTLWTAIFGVIFLGILFGLTYVAVHRSTNLRQFIVAPTSYGPIFVGLALGATSSSAAATLGNPGLVYVYGWSGMWYGFAYGLMVLAWAVSAYTLHRFSRDLGANSLPDFFGKRFDSQFLRAFSAAVTLFLTFYVAGQFAGASLAIRELTPVPYTVGIFVGSAIILAYVLLGGAHAEVLNSAFQGAMMLVLAAIVTVSGFIAVGSIGDMNAAVVAQNADLGWNTVFQQPHFGPFNGPAIFMALGLFALTPQLSRIWMAIDDEKNVKWAVVVGLIFMTAMYLLMLIGGLAGRAVAPNIETPDLATIALIREAMPDIVLAYSGVAIFAAIMSTTAGLILTSAVAVAHDLYKDTQVPMFWPETDEETVESRTMWGTRIVMVLMTIAALAIAFNPPNFLTGLMWVGIGAFTAAFIPLLLWSSVWDGVTPLAAKITAVVGFLTHVIGYFYLGQIAGMQLWAIPWRGTGVGIILGMILVPVLSLLTKQKLDQEFLNDIFYRQPAADNAGSADD